MCGNLSKIRLGDIQYGSSSKEFDLEIDATDELIDLMDQKRKMAGMKDLFSYNDYGNPIYYDFYLRCDLNENRFDVIGVCAHGEKDDWREYYLDIHTMEMHKIMLKLIEYFAHELYES